MGALAVRLLCEGKSNRVVGYRHGEFVDFDIDEALAMEKTIPGNMSSRSAGKLSFRDRRADAPRMTDAIFIRGVFA